MRTRRLLLSFVAALYLGTLVALTFMQGPSAARAPWIWPFGAFVPVGVLLLLLLGRRRWWEALAFSVLGSAWIEAAQMIWMPEGYAKPSDVLFSSVGALFGILVAELLTSPRRRSMHAHESPRVVPQSGSREIPQD